MLPTNNHGIQLYVTLGKWRVRGFWFWFVCLEQTISKAKYFNTLSQIWFHKNERFKWIISDIQGTIIEWKVIITLAGQMASLNTLRFLKTVEEP